MNINEFKKIIIEDLGIDIQLDNNGNCNDYNVFDKIITLCSHENLDSQVLQNFKNMLNKVTDSIIKAAYIIMDINNEYKEKNVTLPDFIKSITATNNLHKLKHYNKE